MGGWACSAQQTSIPFAQLERNAQLSASLTMPSENPALASASGSSSSNSSYSESTSREGNPLDPAISSFVRVPPARVGGAIGSAFYLLNGLHVGMALFDVEMTQHCMANHTCKEGNPLMPSSLGGQLGMNFAIIGYSSFVSYRLKKRGSHIWWISPTVGAAAHTVGVASGFAHQ
jgi:hypothetical protein